MSGRLVDQRRAGGRSTARRLGGAEEQAKRAAIQAEQPAGAANARAMAPDSADASMEPDEPPAPAVDGLDEEVASDPRDSGLEADVIGMAAYRGIASAHAMPAAKIAMPPG